MYVTPVSAKPRASPELTVTFTLFAVLAGGVLQSNKRLDPEDVPIKVACVPTLPNMQVNAASLPAKPSITTVTAVPPVGLPKDGNTDNTIPSTVYTNWMSPLIPPMHSAPTGKITNSTV
jgi:hypothetical protein